MITNTSTREQKLEYLDRIESKADLNDYFDISYETDYLVECEMAHDDFRAGIVKAFNEFMSTNDILAFLTYLRDVRKAL
jgi:hypothetical protein